MVQATTTKDELLERQAELKSRMRARRKFTETPTGIVKSGEKAAIVQSLSEAKVEEPEPEIFPFDRLAESASPADLSAYSGSFFFLHGWYRAEWQAKGRFVFADVLTAGTLSVSTLTFPHRDWAPWKSDYVRHSRRESECHVDLKFSIHQFLSGFGFEVKYEEFFSYGRADLIASHKGLDLIVECGGTNPDRVFSAYDDDVWGFMYVPYSEYTNAPRNETGYLFRKTVSGESE